MATTKFNFFNTFFTINKINSVMVLNKDYRILGYFNLEDIGDWTIDNSDIDVDTFQYDWIISQRRVNIQYVDKKSGFTYQVDCNIIVHS